MSGRAVDGPYVVSKETKGPDWTSTITYIATKVRGPTRLLNIFFKFSVQDNFDMLLLNKWPPFSLFTDISLLFGCFILEDAED